MAARRLASLQRTTTFAFAPNFIVRHKSSAIPMNGPGHLVALGDTTQLSPHVTRILGQNPSMMTLQGTNSYLLQPPSSPLAPCLLIDTSSPGKSAGEYVELVMSRLRGGPDTSTSPAPGSTSGSAAPIAHIVLTHRHVDHTGAVPTLLLALKAQGLPPPRIWKMPSPDEEKILADPQDRVHSDTEFVKVLSDLDEGLFVPFKEGQPLHPLADGAVVAVVDADQGSTASLEDTTDKAFLARFEAVPEPSRVSVKVVPTPGHTADSISLVQGEGERGVFTGDTVLGQGTTIFHDFAAYLASLKRLLALRPAVIYPAHGPHIIGEEAAYDHLAEYIKHRQAREDLIVGVLRSVADKPGTLGSQLDTLRDQTIKLAASPEMRQALKLDLDEKALGILQRSAATAEEAKKAGTLAEAFPTEKEGEAAQAIGLHELCMLVYKSGFEPLLGAAARSTSSHLVKLVQEGRVVEVTAAVPRVTDWKAGEGVGIAYKWVGKE